MTGSSCALGVTLRAYFPLDPQQDSGWASGSSSRLSFVAFLTAIFLSFRAVHAQRARTRSHLPLFLQWICNQPPGWIPIDAWLNKRKRTPSLLQELGASGLDPLSCLTSYVIMGSSAPAGSRTFQADKEYSPFVKGYVESNG